MKLRYFSIGLKERVVDFNGRNSWRAFIESKSRKEKEMSMWIATKHPAIVFENTEVGRLKKKIRDASEERSEQILMEYEISAPFQ